MDVNDWRAALQEITAPGGWIGRLGARGERARAWLNRLSAGQWVPHHIKADEDAEGRFVQPAASYAALMARDDLLPVTLASELLRLVRSEPGAGLAEVVRTALAGALASGVRLGVRPFHQADPAQVDAIRRYFDDEKLGRAALRRVDRSFGTRLEELLGARPADVGTYAGCYRLGQLWTAASALALLDWAKVQGAATPADLVRLFWHGVRPDNHEAVNGLFLPGPPLFPSARRGLHVDYCLFPALAQVFEGRDVNDRLPSGAVGRVHVPIRSNNVVYTGAQPYYNGRDTRQLYLTALVLCLHAGNRLHPGV